MINVRCFRITLHRQTNLLLNGMSPIYLTVNQSTGEELLLKPLLYNLASNEFIAN